MAKQKNSFKSNQPENNKKYIIEAGINSKELQKLKVEITTAIRSRSTTKPTDTNILNQLPNIADQILEIYDEYPDKEILNDILESIANYMIQLYKLDDLKDLHDIKNNSTFNTLTSIHSKILFEGNKSIPENFSISYFEDITIARYHKRNNPESPGINLSSTDLIYDDEILDFIENLGKDFRIKNPEQYLNIVKAVLYDPIKKNPSISNDPGINQNERILNILVDYVRAYKDCADKQGLNKDLEISDIVSTIQLNFSTLIGQMKPENWERLRKKLYDCFNGLQLQRLPKDITSYKSFAEFIDDVNKNIIDTVDPDHHDPIPREIIIPREDTEGMRNDEKFSAIQALVSNLRKKDPDLIIPTVWVGYKSPFEGYLVLPFSKAHYAGRSDSELGEKEQENPIYNVVISDIFSNRKGCFRAMTRDSVTKVLGSDKNSAGPEIHGATTRTASNSIPGVIAIIHTKDKGMDYYAEMIQEAVEAVAKDPTIEFGKPLRRKISEMNKTTTAKKSRQKPVTNNSQQQSVSNVDIPTPTTTARLDTDEYGYDKYGINLDELVSSVPFTSQNGKYQAEKREAICDDLKEKYGYGRNPSLDLLDFCLEEMLISGKNIVNIVQELAARPEYRNIPDALNKMYAYVKNMVIVAVDNDPDYPNEKMKEIYERELEALEIKGTELDTEIAEKREKISKLKENIGKTYLYFNADYEK